LTLQQFLPAGKLGHFYTSREGDILGEIIAIKFRKKRHALRFLNNLNKIDNKEVSTITVQNKYVLDFSNYNSASTNVLRRRMSLILRSMQWK
jgi:6-phosphogluconolactonase (cycloisomerase 2 family)